MDDDAPTLTEQPGESTPPASLPAAPLPSLLFGRYRPLRELGRGGMGVVLLVQDEVLNVPMALKLVPQQVVQDTEGIHDLKKEVLRGMALTHPGIVRVYSFERAEETAGIVMEYVEGETLGERKLAQAGGCFNCADLQPWLEQLCAALDYAHHEAKIAHRDLKPRNLIITPAGRLKVADFGIASSLTDSMSRVSVRVDSSGTPPYMSPQQAMGERPTHLDDIYSLGATIYELLTGKPPFFRGNILAQAAQQTVPTMSERRRELGVEGKAPIPAEWETLVGACLAKEPRDRPANGAAVLAHLRGQPLPAPVPLAQKPEPLIRVLPNPAPLATFKEGASPAPVLMPIVREESVAERPFEWPRQVVLVILAAALTAGAIQFTRHRTAKTEGPAAVSEASTPPVAAVKEPAAPTPAPKRAPSALGERSLGPAKGLNLATPGRP